MYKSFSFSATKVRSRASIRAEDHRRASIRAQDHRRASIRAQDHGRASIRAEDPPLRLHPAVHHYASLLRRCGDSQSLDEGAHAHRLVRDCGLSSYVYIGNLLVQMYGKCGALASAESAFAEIEGPNVFSYSLMIGVYVQACHSRKAYQLSLQIQQRGVFPDKITFITLLSACCSSEWLLFGKRVHACMMHLSSDRDIVACTALVNMYGNCGDVGCARHGFDVMVNRNVISWNAMIKAYAVNGHGCAALGVYDRMLMEGMVPNNVTLICVIDACECFRALSKGKSMHACIGFVPEHKADVVISNALINLYGKCGDIVDAVKAFSRMQTHNLSSWNSIISIHGQHGDGERAVSLFASMCKERVRPDQITYFGLLSACSHSGLVEEGCHYFTTMRNTADVPTTVEHYNCIIDLLGRAGWLDCIEDLIVRYMSVTPDVKSWVTLLGACRIHSDVARMERVVEYMFHDMELENPTPSDVLLANM